LEVVRPAATPPDGNDDVGGIESSVILVFKRCFFDHPGSNSSLVEGNGVILVLPVFAYLIVSNTLKEKDFE